VEVLKDAEPVGLEVNLGGLGAFMSPDDERRGRGECRADLVFKKGTTYYVVEVTDKIENIKQAERKAQKYARRLQDSAILLGNSKSVEIIPVVAYPDLGPTRAQSEMLGLV